MKKSSAPQLSKLQVALLMAFTVGSAQAAVDLSAFGEITLGGTLPPVYSNTETSNSSLDILPWDWYGLTPNGALIHTYGSAEGSFGSRSSGDGIYNVLSTFSITETWTNTSGSAIQGSFNFNIVPGQVANYQRTSYQESEYVAADMAMNIKVNGSDSWHSGASVRSDTSGLTLSHSGADIGYIQHGAQSDPWYGSNTTTGYFFNNYAGQLDLGTIAAGASITVEYDIRTHAYGNSMDHGGMVIPGYIQHVPEQQVWVWDNGYGGGCYGGDCYGGGIGHWETIAAHDVQIADQLTSGGANGSIAQTGDPFEIAGERYYPGGSTYDAYHLPLQGGIQPVPEPESYAMMLAGLIGIGWSVRRRKRLLAS